ncbi:MAG: hypothetical protein WA624_17415 [Methylocella sp.]
MKVIIAAASSSSRHIKIKWAFQTPQFVLQNNYSQFMLYFLLPDIKNANLSIYASRSPTFYFAWISIPEKDEKLDIDSEEFNAPKGTFGFVMLYGHLAEYDDRPEFYFDKSEIERKGPLLNYYVASTKRFFDYGLLPPSNSTNSMANTPYLFKLNVEDRKKAENKWLLENIKCP